MKYNTGLVEYKLIPEFLDVSFTKNKGDISIEQFVKNLYEAERIDILIQIFRYFEPESYYLGYHGYFDVENVNPLVDFYTSYNVEKGIRERDRKIIAYHTNIDIGILKKHAYILFELQKELNETLDGINAAQKLNKNIASVYRDVSKLDSHIIWKHHDRLYIDAIEEVFLEEVTQDIDIKQINFEEYDPNTSLSREEEEKENNLMLEKVLKIIKEKEKKYKIPNMINFDLDRYNSMKTLMGSPHFDLSNDNYLIAKFAGAATPLLEKRLKEVNLQYGQPVRNPYTGVWNYTITYTTNFIGLLYRHFLDYVNLMMDNLGYIPTCAWCKTPINPTPQQLRWLKNGSDIYCLEANQEPYDSCKRKGTTNKQNEKRRKQKERKIQVKSNIESIADRKIKNHITGKNLLTTEEQGDFILQSISVNLNQKFN